MFPNVSARFCLPQFFLSHSFVPLLFSSRYFSYFWYLSFFPTVPPIPSFSPSHSPPNSPDPMLCSVYLFSSGFFPYSVAPFFLLPAPFSSLPCLYRDFVCHPVQKLFFSAKHVGQRDNSTLISYLTWSARPIWDLQFELSYLIAQPALAKLAVERLIVHFLRGMSVVALKRNLQ